MDVADVLRAAAAAQEAVTMVYNGGSHPGSARVVIPVTIGDSTLEAIDTATHVRKSFKLSMSSSVQRPNGQASDNATITPPPASSVLVRDFEQNAATYVPQLVERGWHVERGDRRIALYEFFKNGKPKRTSSVSIQFEDRSKQSVIDPDTGEFITIDVPLTGRERPWVMSSKRFGQSKAFAEITRAFNVFLDEAEALAPKPGVRLESVPEGVILATMTFPPDSDQDTV